MAIVIESVSTQATYTAVTDLGSAGSFVVTKPAGVEVGDMLLVITSTLVSTDYTSPPSGWTEITITQSANMTVNAWYRLADSADVAATEYTFTTARDSTDYCYRCYRLTGTATSRSPVIAQVDDEQTITSSTTVVGTISLEQKTGTLLIGISNVKLSSGRATVTSFELTGTAVTFTERIDDEAGDRSFYLADGISTDDVKATSYTTTFDADETGTFYTNILAIYPQKDVTGTLDFIEETDTAFNISGNAGVKGTLDFIEETDDTFDIDGKVKEPPTAWTNEARVSTTWTNESQ